MKHRASGFSALHFLVSRAGSWDRISFLSLVVIGGWSMVEGFTGTQGSWVTVVCLGLVCIVAAVITERITSKSRGQAVSTGGNEERLPLRVNLRHSQPCPECRLLGLERTKSAR